MLATVQGIFQPWFERLNFLRTLIISAIILTVGISCGYVTPTLFANFLKSVSAKIRTRNTQRINHICFSYKYFFQQLNLTPKSDVRELYVKTPFYLNFKVYLFNLTNPYAVTKGMYISVEIDRFIKCNESIFCPRF